MAIRTFPEAEREVKRQNLELSHLREDVRNLRDRIATASGAFTASPFTAAGSGSGESLSGTIIAGQGLSGGGALPGTVSLEVNQGYNFTWSSTHTYDDGAGDSPSIRFLGGTNNDEISIFLDDDALITRSDLIVKLAEHNGLSSFIVRGENDVDIWGVTSNGAMWWDASTNGALIEFNGDTNITTNDLTLSMFDDISAPEFVFSGGNVGINIAEEDATLAIYDTEGVQLRILEGGYLADIYVSGGDLHFDVDDGDIYLNPAGTGDEVIFANWVAGNSLKSSDYISQTDGWAINYGNDGGDADFRYIFADEMHVKAFVMDTSMALAGAIILTKSRARLSRNFVIPDTGNPANLYVEDLEGYEGIAVFVANDIVLLRVIDHSGGGLVVANVYGLVTGYSDVGGGEQQWTFFTLTASYSSADEVYRGTVALDYGQLAVGTTGVWEATVLDTFSPYTQVQTWDTIDGNNEPSNFTTHVRVGHLEGITGNEEFGIFAGKQLADKQYVVLSDVNVEMHGVETSWYDASGNLRILIDPTATGSSDLFAAGPDVATDKQFTISGAGDVWMSMLTLSDSIGDLLYSQNDGMFLVDFTKTEYIDGNWYVHSSGEATGLVTGGMAHKQGRWSGHKAMVFEEAGKNWLPNPMMKDSVPDGRADLLGRNTSSAATPTETVDEYVGRGWWQRCEHTADAGDSGAYLNYTMLTDDASFAEDDPCTFSAWVSVKTQVGCTLTIRITALTAAEATIATVANAITVTGTPQRFSITYPALPATTDHVRVYLRVASIDPGDSIDFRFSRWQVEKLDYMTSYMDGDMGQGFDWDSTRHASFSTREITGLNFDNYANMFIGVDPMSVVAWVQPLRDYDVGTTTIYNFVHMFDIVSNSIEYQMYYSKSSGTIKVELRDDAGVSTLESSALTFSAGEHLCVATTASYNASGAGVYKLYINAVLEDSLTTSNIAPMAALDRCRIGISRSGTNPAQSAISQVAVFASELSLDAVAAIYAKQGPLVDLVSDETPGLYIIDGQFTLMSSTTGERIEMDSSGMYGYDEDDTLQVAWYGSGDNAGKIVAGGGAVWIDEDGVSLGDGTYGSSGESVSWLDSNSYEFASMQSYTLSTQSTLAIDIDSGGSGITTSRIRLAATGDSSWGGIATVDLNGLTVDRLTYGYAHVRCQGGMSVGTSSIIGANIGIGQVVQIQQSPSEPYIEHHISSFASGATSVMSNTDSFAEFLYGSSSTGGLWQRALKKTDGYGGVRIDGYVGGSTNTTKSIAGRAIVEMYGAQYSGTSYANVAADGNVFGVMARRGGSWRMVFIVDEDGDVHANANAGLGGDASMWSYDEYDDHALITAARAAMFPLKHEMQETWREFVEYGRPILEEAGVIHYDDESGTAMYSNRGLHSLTMDGIRQLWSQVNDMKVQLALTQQALIENGIALPALE